MANSEGLQRSSISSAQVGGSWGWSPLSAEAWLQLLKLSNVSLIEKSATKEEVSRP